MRFDDVAAAVRGLRNMTPEQGRIIYDHVRETRPQQVLELGTSFGVSAAYIAAALDENGSGSVTTVDHQGSNIPEALERVGEAVAARVTAVRVSDSSYVWWLRDQVSARSDAAGNCDPVYDLCYLDGAHNFTIDGLAVVLVEKLLMPGGWLILDDLEWSYRDDPYGLRERGVYFPLSDDERRVPHVRAVFDVIVKQHPSLTDLRVQDKSWAWAHKDDAAPRRLALETSRPLRAIATGLLRDVIRLVAVATQAERARLRQSRADRAYIEREIEVRAIELARTRADET